MAEAQKFELDPDPASTYGKTEEYIAAWNEKYGNKQAKENAGEEGPAPTGVVGNSPGISAEQEGTAQEKSKTTRS
jgi:hypothetical protein